MAAPAAPVQRETVGLIVVAVLLAIALILRRLSAGDEGRQSRNIVSFAAAGLLWSVVGPGLMLLVLAVLLIIALWLLMIAILLMMLARLVGLLLVALLIRLRLLRIGLLLVAR